MKQSIGEMVSMILSMGRINREVARLTERGYPIRSILDILQNDEYTHTVVYTSPQFQPCAQTFTDKYAFVGPSIRPAAGAFPKNGDRLVYLSMGTVNNNMMQLYRSCIAAFADAPYQVVISAGEKTDVQALAPLPANVRVFSHVDQIAVLEQADAFVSHCGMNSASESLYFGVPLVVLPQTTEQRGVAARVLQMGAGVKPDRVSGKAIRAAVDRVLADDSLRLAARAVGDGFRACSGAKGAADKILRVASGNRV